MPGHAADRNLLFGILALQMDFITRDALIAAMNAWVLEKHRPLGEILVERGSLDPKFRALLEPIVDAHVERHQGDPARSLAAMSSIVSFADDLRRAVADTDVLASIIQFMTESQDDSHANPGRQTADYIPAGIRYQKLRDHAEGGLGVVFVARDEELHREVALKEIKAKYADNPASRARFLIEAEITGGLEHPGIVPVYGLGHYDDGRPYYAMRFIRGDSLKDAIAAFHADKTVESDPGARTLALQKLLRRFLDVCNAVAYAHSRGVLHRDLKPDNVMVGRYGETLVVDWGLAKAVGRSVEDGYGPLSESTLMYKSSKGSAETAPGSVIGTPAYMSPEQAAGRLDLLGPHSDVYSLGATLYVLLTSRVPVSGSDLGEILRKVEKGQFPRPREVSPWLDPALEAICLKAMDLEPEARYATPRALSEDVERWLADEPVSTYREPFTRRARRWARRHRTALATAASAAMVAGLMLGGFAWMRIAQRQATDAAARATLARAGGLAIEARTSGDLPRWDQAIAEALRARERLESGGGSLALHLEADARLEAFRDERARRREALAAEAKDRRVVDALEEARLQASNIRNDLLDLQARNDAFRAAFGAYGIDLETLSVEDAAGRVRASKVADDLNAALDEWIRSEGKKALAERMRAIARAAETDPVRIAIREAVARRDTAALRRFCESEEDRRKLGPRLGYVFFALVRLDLEGSLTLLEAILREHPSDLWLNDQLGTAYLEARPPNLPEAVRRLSVAVALRPKSPGVHLNLGVALGRQGKADLAIAEYREALRIKPDYAAAHRNLGVELNAQGKVDQAIDELREALRINPNNADVHHGLGLFLERKREHDRAIAEYHEALRINPDHAGAHVDLGVALSAQGKVDLAIAEYRKAVRIKPDDIKARNNIGLALAAQGKLDQAVAEFREVLLIDPDYAEAHSNLGTALQDQGKGDQALAEFHDALRIKPELFGVRRNIGRALAAQGKLDQAIAAYRDALRVKPDYAEAYLDLGGALHAQGKVDQAIAAFLDAIRIDPDYAEAHCNLGVVLTHQGRLREALEHLERGHELGSKRPNWRQPSKAYVLEVRRLIELEAKIPAFLKGEATPVDVSERLTLADICYKTGRPAASAHFWEEAFAAQPALLDDLAKGLRYYAARSASLASSGSGKDDPAPDEAARVKLREKALAWLRADLAAWGKVLDGGNEPARKQAVVRTLAHWKEDADLAGIRDDAALAKLPEGEREGFRALWAEVDRLLAKARAVAP